MDKNFLYGMCDIAYSNYIYKGIDYKKTSVLMEHLGVRSVRNWMHFSTIMDERRKVDEKKLSLMKNIVGDLESHNFTIIGMNHENYHKAKEGHQFNFIQKPRADDPYYEMWLFQYESDWYHLVSLFPSITYWEIDNEPNNDVFMTGSDGSKIPLNEKAKIFTDMMYFASMGIHKANPKAITIMGGLVTFGNPEKFLQMIYDNIRCSSISNEPDDYFQVACWHPYMDDYTDQKFIQVNDSLYSIVKKNEKKDKSVFLTEMGWSEYNVSLDKIIGFIPAMFNIVKNKLTYIKTINYFRIFDDLLTTWGTPCEKIYGMIKDPKSYGNFNKDFVLGTPKLTAFAYQKATKGKGDLDIFVNSR